MFEALQIVPDRAGMHGVDVGGSAVDFGGGGCSLKLFDCEHAGRSIEVRSSGGIGAHVGVRRHGLGGSW